MTDAAMQILAALDSDRGRELLRSIISEIVGEHIAEVSREMGRTEASVRRAAVKPDKKRRTEGAE